MSIQNQEIKLKLHNHIQRLYRKGQLPGRYHLRKYLIVLEPDESVLAYLCQIENIDTKIIETLLVKHRDLCNTQENQLSKLE